MPKRKVPEKELPSFKTPEERQIEEETGHTLTMRQRRFAEAFVKGNTSARAAAIKAGYSPKSAASIAYHLQNPKESPQVVAYMAHLREEMELRYGVTKENMLRRLHKLSHGAEKNGQFSAAINAEKIRASLGGLTIDRRETVSRIEDMTKDQVLARLEDLRKKNPGLFTVLEGSYQEVTGHEQRSRGEPLAIDAEILAPDDEPDED